MSLFAVLNALFHSRKFQAFVISLTIAILIPLVNRWTGLELSPPVIETLVMGAVFGGVAYGASTAYEDAQKAHAQASVLASAGISPEDVVAKIAEVVRATRRT